MEYILVLFMYTTSTETVAATNIQGFLSQQDCQAAGKLASEKLSGWSKSTMFVCLPQKKQ